MKYLGRVFPLLRRLHDVGCERDKAGNRDLHMDQYCALNLLFLFSPSIHSLRTIQRTANCGKSKNCSAVAGPRWARCRKRSRCSSRSGWRKSSPSSGPN